MTGKIDYSLQRSMYAQEHLQIHKEMRCWRWLILMLLFIATFFLGVVAINTSKSIEVVPVPVREEEPRRQDQHQNNWQQLIRHTQNAPGRSADLC